MGRWRKQRVGSISRRLPLRNASAPLKMRLAPRFLSDPAAREADSSWDGDTGSRTKFLEGPARPQVNRNQRCSLRAIASGCISVGAGGSAARHSSFYGGTILASEPFIRLGRTSWTGRMVDRYLRQAGIRPNERFELDSLEAIAGMVDRGLGVSLVPDWTAPWPEGLSLRKVQLPGRPVVRRIGAIWAIASVRVQLVQAFIEEATTVIKLRHRAK
jgi:DNA-binding transcriptional LysR family regulator